VSLTRGHILASSARTRRWLAVGLLTAAVAGCSYGITVRHVADMPLAAAWQASAVENDELSQRTLQTLRQLDLATLYQRRPEEAFNRLHALAVANPTRDLLFALAETSYVMGRHAEKRENGEAVVYYYLCAGYAYHCLFDCRGAHREAGGGDSASTVQTTRDAPAPFPIPDAGLLTPVFDPRFRLACDLYNTSLAKCIRAAQRFGRLDSRQELHLPCPNGQEFRLSVMHLGFAWRPEEFGPLLFCADYQVVGLENHFRGYGLGVPLIGTRLPTAPDHPNVFRNDAFYPHEVSFPVTAFFRFEGSLADLGARHAGRLELYNPLAIQGIPLAGHTVPLETDLTTPLAYFLSKSDLENVGVVGFLRPDNLNNRTGIYMFEPYDPGKIPVVMVHGLLSSPLTWTPLFNELRADPELRKHFQFWFYLYPTANPYLASAADLHESLKRLRFELDPQRRDRALDQMVLVGHSMGGLVSKLMTLNSGDDFWRLVSAEPFDAVKGDTADRDELRRVFFFEPEPAIKRVIFLATPHHGSKLSPSPPAQLIAKFIRLPQKLMMAARDVAQENPGLWPGAGKNGSAARVPTSLDLLTPGAPALELLAHRSAPVGVHYHSIIGDIYHKGLDGSDGVVPYKSAHIDGVESELVVPADHLHVHHHPQAVLEVRRILLEHARTANLNGGAIIPVAHVAPGPLPQLGPPQ
jgi:pimeloyl-ACP methyl ester carboxylesterase